MSANSHKFSAAAIGASLATVIVWTVNQWLAVNTHGIIVPGEVASAFGGLLTYAASAIIPDDKED